MSKQVWLKLREEVADELSAIAFMLNYFTPWRIRYMYYDSALRDIKGAIERLEKLIGKVEEIKRLWEEIKK